MSLIQIRIDESTKKEAQKLCAKMGISLSAAIKIFLLKMIAENGIPFDIKTADQNQKATNNAPQSQKEIHNNENSWKPFRPRKIG